MKIAKLILASAVVIAAISSGAVAQQAQSGLVSKVDEANGKITIQQTQGGTVGATTGGAANDFKVQDGLMFNALKEGDIRSARPAFPLIKTLQGVRRF